MAVSKFPGSAINSGTSTTFTKGLFGNGSTVEEHPVAPSKTLTSQQYSQLSAAEKAEDILYVITDDENPDNYQPVITADGVLQGDGNGNITARGVDVTPTEGSTNLITSGGVKSAIFPSTPTGAIELWSISQGGTPDGTYAYLTIPCWNPAGKNVTINAVFIYNSSGSIVKTYSGDIVPGSMRYSHFTLKYPFDAADAGKGLYIQYQIN